MSLGIAVFLVGLFLVPFALLLGGHRLRRLPAPQRRAFWGAVTGHCLAGVLALAAALAPPEAWTPDERVRGFLGLWSLLIFPAIGAIGGAVTAPK